MPTRAAAAELEAEIDRVVYKKRQPLVVDVSDDAAQLLLMSRDDATLMSFISDREDVVPASEGDDEPLNTLRDALPGCVRWRRDGDLLAQLPMGAEPHVVAKLRCAAKSEFVQEDVRGVCWVNALLVGGVESVTWLVVPGESKRAAFDIFKRRKAWPSSEELTGAGVGGVKELTQKPGQLVLLPPHALAMRRVGPGGAVLLQWCRAGLGAFASRASSYDYFATPPAKALPPLKGASAVPAAWRRLQLHPPVALAAFRALGEAVGAASHDAEAAKPAAALRALLGPCRFLLHAESVSSAAAASWAAHGGDSTPITLDDHAPRACDHCAAEIFNTFLRLKAPTSSSSSSSSNGKATGSGSSSSSAATAAAAQRVPEPAWHNPRRLQQRSPGDQGDFCLSACRCRSSIPSPCLVQPARVSAAMLTSVLCPLFSPSLCACLGLSGRASLSAQAASRQGACWARSTVFGSCSTHRPRRSARPCAPPKICSVSRTKAEAAAAAARRRRLRTEPSTLSSARKSSLKEPWTTTSCIRAFPSSRRMALATPTSARNGSSLTTTMAMTTTMAV